MDLKKLLRSLVYTTTVIITGATAQPTITSFMPTSGPIGTGVTISGTNFNTTASKNIVHFGAVQALVSSATSASLIITVPVGATYAPISVTDSATGLTAYSNAPFVITFYSIRNFDATTFAPKVDFAAGPGPQSVAVGDLDGDGKPDVVTANYPSTFSVFRNTSTSGTIASSSFAPKVDITTGANPIVAAIGDLDGDGKPDVVIVNFQDKTFSVFRNTSTIGSITFASNVDFATGTGVYNVAMGDLDGDGKPDIVMTNYENNTFSVLRNTSTLGSITASSFAPRVDFTTGINPMGIAINDLDGDGKPDVVVSNFAGNLSVFRNTGSSGSITFAPKLDVTALTGQSTVAIGDLDADGKPDVIKTNNGQNTFSVFRNTSVTGSISFAARVDFSGGYNLRSVAVGDLDGDGKPDLAIIKVDSARVSVFKNTSSTGSIAFASDVEYATPNGPMSIAIADVDGDARPDLLTSNYSGTLSVFRNAIIVFSAVPSVPTLHSPANSAINQATSVTLQWHRTQESNAYHLQCGTDSTFATGIMLDDSTVTDTTKTITGLSVSTKYFWRVAAWNTIGSGSFSSVRMFMTIVPAPTSVTASPGNQRITLNWTASAASNILRYRLYRGTSSPASTLVDSMSTTQSVDSNLTNGVRYFYRMTAVNTLLIEGPFSSEVSTRPFTSPTLALPADGGTNLPIAFTLAWYPSPGASTYHVQCGTDSTFAAGIVVDDPAVVDTTKTITGLSISTKYFWRVAASEEGVTSPFSPMRRFITIIPSPTSVTLVTGNQRITLDWTPSAASNILRYRLYRGTSSPASTLIDSTSTTHYVDSNLTNGMRYFYRMTAVNTLLIEGPFSTEVSTTPLNAPPHANAISDIYQPNSSTVLSSITFSSQGSFDSDGTVDSIFWFVNGSLLGQQPQFTHDFGQGTNKVMLIVQDNQGARDTSTATVNRSKFKFFLSGGVYAGPSLLGDNILYVIGTGDAVYRLDSSGKDLYSLQVGGEVKSSSSIAYDTTVYIASSDNNLYAFSKFGVSLWSVLPLGGLMTSTPAVDSITNWIYIGVSNKNFFAVERLTGKVAWSFFVDAPILGSAAITLDRKLVFATVKGTMYGLDLNELSSPPIPSWQLTLSDSIIGSPAIDGDGYVYYCTNSGRVIKISLPRSQQPTIVWQTQIGGSIVGSPVIDGYSNLYVGCTDAKLYAINTQNGDVKWTYESGSPILSTPAVSDIGLIYFGNHGGRVFAIDTSAVLRWYYQDSTSVDAPLLYQRGVLYVGTVGGRLIAFYDDADSSARSISNSLAFRKRTDALRLPVWGTFQGNNQRTGLPIGKTVTQVGEPEIQIPEVLSLSQNYPNPFNPSTTIRYDLPKQSFVTLKIYDLLGREVATLVNEVRHAGFYTVRWDASRLSSGVYFYTLRAGEFRETKRMILMK
jgi:outer membrane protein assembly factor BamB/fibronectin type 3 domain-containing protein